MMENMDFAFMHSAPRFGYSDNIAQLASPERHSRWDYINGLISFAAFFMSFFFLWALSEIIFKKLGVERVGCLAGQATDSSTYMANSRIKWRHKIIRIGFLLASVLVFVGGAILLGNGLPTINEAIRETMGLSEDVQLALKLGIDVAQTGESARESFVSTDLPEMLLNDEFCTNTDLSVVSLLFNETSDHNEESISLLRDFRDGMKTEDAAGIKSGLEHLLKNFRLFDDVSLVYDKYHWIARMTVLILFNFCMFLAISTVVILRRNESFPPLLFMTSYFVTPCFILLAFAIVIVTAGLSVGAIMNSDFCFGNGEGPESTVENAFLENGFDTNDMTYQAFIYFKNECALPEPWESSVDEFRNQTKQGLDLVESLSARVNEIGSENFLALCGREITPVVNGIFEVKRDIMRLTKTLDNALQLSTCERVSPIYHSFFEGPTCNTSLAGMSWAFYGLTFVCIGCFLAISLRSALYPIKALNYEDVDSLDATNEQLKQMEKEIREGRGRTFSSDLSSSSLSNSEDDESESRSVVFSSPGSSCSSSYYA